jgi:hypothetical protein
MVTRIIKIAALLPFMALTALLVSYKDTPDGIYADPQQALRAFTQLNKVRKDPNSFTERYNVSLKDVAAQPDLAWSDTLAEVAQAWALDMAQHDYLGNVNKDGYGVNYFMHKAGYRLDTIWRKYKKTSTFVAIDGGSPSGETAIKALVVDKDNSSLDERKLLLGIGDFNASLHDCGIGFVHGTKDTKYRNYTVVIIAKHHP